MALVRKQLRHLVQARSGDKGNTINIAVIAPNAEVYAVLLQEVTVERVKAHFCGMVEGDVKRYEVPGLHAMNFVCRGALGGGGSRTLRIDNLGKCYAANLMRLEIDIDDTVLAGS
ncbi:hypothetical protein A8990_106172 [Paenibacillus taihuensis]|uniref:AtuA-like ferredoxin-fold domain-containing protein n=1 Tax=Paenibacillus taihuensis TaxID=1156355 RepID=A0A3D9SBM5_9BACL|nr:hypothetical protein [Paenibacillus taihuensis]REE90667.1 hypothetical protein A8990_106172 [Paenibacillus taihuensis]